MANADRTVTTTLRLKIDDLKTKSREASKAYKDIGESANESGEKATRSSKKATTANVSLGQSILKNKDTINQLSTSFAVAGIGLAGFATKAVLTFADFDKQMSNVAATGDDARQNIDALRETAMRLGADTQFSAGEAANGLEELLKAGVSASDAINGGLKGALDLAAAGEISVADAAETAATAMVQFRLSGADVPHVADLLAAAAGKAQGGVSDMAMALKQGGLVAAQMGLSIEETTGGLAAFAAAGLLGSDAGTALKTMLLRLANPSDGAAAAMENVGVKAYDAQGNFVGLEKLAGQLQTGMKDLTQAQRDQALATIFGSDAIRAANVLYLNGAGGIGEWQDAVDDAGYAAETAATRTDNLMGDIERLGGSIDSVFIKGGKGGNDFLRGLVQGATDASDAIGNIDGDILSLGAGLAGVAGFSLIGLAGLGKFAVGLVETREAMKQLNTDMPKLAKGMRGVSTAGLAIAGALTVALAANAAFNATVGKTTASVGEMTNALRGLTRSGDGVDLDKIFRMGGTGETVALKQVKDFSSAVDAWKVAQNGWEQFQNAIWSGLPGETSLEKLTKQFETLDTAMAGMDPGQAAETFRDVEERARRAGATTEDLIKLFPQMADQAYALADANNYKIQSDEELVGIMRGDLPAAMVGLMASNDAGKKSLNDLGVEAEDLWTTLQKLAEAQEEAAKNARAAAHANIGFEQALDDAAAAGKEAADKIAKGELSKKDALDVGTEAGRKNMEQLLGIVDAAEKNTDAIKENKGSLSDLNKVNDRAYESFVKTAGQMGKNSYEAAVLAIKYGLIPPKVTTDILAPGVKATQRQIDEVNKGLDDVPGEYKAELMSIFMEKGYSAWKAAYDRVKDKTSTVTTVYKTVVDGRRWEIGDDGPVTRRAQGGTLPGYTPRRDVHKFYSPTGGLLELSGGESVMVPEWTRAVGGAGAVAQMNAAARRGQAFADGGTYQPTYQPARSSSTTIVQSAPLSLEGMSIVGVLDLGGGLEGRIQAVLSDHERAKSTTVRRRG